MKDLDPALVQRDRPGRSRPIRSGQLCDADGLRASRIHHAVEDGDADGSLGLLAGQLSGMQVVTEDTLVACHRGFRLGPPAIVGVPLPAQPALGGKGLDMGDGNQSCVKFIQEASATPKWQFSPSKLSETVT